ncbi:hypothetical protein Cob_v000907 [Colletotrichum orbiculare MAFF 240422]|uniref:Uncharacterized protein n=1 Tax=Colletotrichum orbiculare (strain 104-T / ATCC 96160 / CBS 514.97 / LARS 414 / MAFF 240422) TaxID=1213857 RepID=A0A484G7T9_COLOR|nr:hypothetical protein Cob_v000907 [Colletotrichum orbiculare MAFF 240422]
MSALTGETWDPDSDSKPEQTKDPNRNKQKNRSAKVKSNARKRDGHHCVVTGAGSASHALGCWWSPNPSPSSP